MSAVIHDFPAKQSADSAWARYSMLAARAIDDNRLMLDRGFSENLVRARLAWEEAFAREVRLG